MSKFPTVRLGDVADVNWGDTSVTKASYVDDGFPAYSATGCDGFLPYADFDQPAIVLSAIGARCGKTWFASGKWSCIKNTIRYWSTIDNLDNRYLFWATADEDFWPKRGAAQPFITIGDARDLRIPLPPLIEQRRIAAILDKADALRTNRREALAQLDLLAQSIFVEMFGDPVTNSKGWQKRPLGEVFEIARGGSPRPIDDYITDAPDGINWVMIGDTEQGGKYIRSTKKKIRPEGVKRSRMVKSGDFLLTNSMSFGRPYILKTDGCIHDGWLVLSPKVEDFDADYFYALLGSRAVFSEFSKRAAGATVKNLNIDLVSGVEVAVPPLEKQLEFAGAMRKVEASKSRVEAAVGHLSALFNCLQARAFAGEL